MVESGAEGSLAWDSWEDLEINSTSVEGEHRTRKNTEEKAKVVALVGGCTSHLAARVI